MSEKITKIQRDAEEGLNFKGVWKFTIRDAKTGQIKRVNEYHNLIPTAGRAQVAKALSGALSVIADIEINETSLGTGTTPAANTDIKLQTETYRKTVASNTNADNILYVTAFYSAPEVTGTFSEAGLHIKGTGAVDSGTLFSRVILSPSVTKALTETLTIDYTVTMT